MASWLLTSIPVGGVAPVIACSSGARRAGQGRDSGERSERPLDAPKRFRIIEPGATWTTANRDADRGTLLAGLLTTECGSRQLDWTRAL